MSRFRQGWELTKKSWALLRSHRELFRFPIYAALAAIVIVAITVGPGFYLIEDGQRVIGGLLVAIGLYLSSFIAIYTGVGLAATADAIFHGREATVADGFAVARERLGAIAGWAALAALVGTLISLIQQSGSIGEAIVGSLVGAAWSLITFLAVPVITFEGTGPWATLKRSASLFKERWRGQVAGNVAIGGIVGLLGVLPAVLLIAGGVYVWIVRRRHRRAGGGRGRRARRRAAAGRLDADHPGDARRLRRRALPLRRRGRGHHRLHRGGLRVRGQDAGLARLAGEQPRVVGADPVDAERREALDPLRRRRPSRRSPATPTACALSTSRPVISGW